MKSIKDQNSITLREHDHKYILKDCPNLLFTSVTTWIGTFFPKFDSQKMAQMISEKTSNPSNKYYGKTKDEILGMWNTISSIGTLVHKEIEDYIISGITPQTVKAQNAMMWLMAKTQTDDLEGKVELYPEVKLYSVKYHLAGTIDLLIHHKPSGMWIIADWKTNEKITDVAYNSARGIHPATYNLDAHKLNIYSLQMSVYRYLLETEYGIHPKKQILLHLLPETSTQYPLGIVEYHTPYLKYNVNKMFNSRLKDGIPIDGEISGSENEEVDDN